MQSSPTPSPCRPCPRRTGVGLSFPVLLCSPRRTTKSRSILRRRKRRARFSSNCTATTPSKAAPQPSSGCCQPRDRSTKRSSSPQGLNDWSEVGFYVFTEEHNGTGIQWVGDHIRPRVRVPPELALAGGRQRVERDRLCARGLCESNLGLADHAHRRQDRRQVVLVGQHHNGLGNPPDCPSAGNAAVRGELLLPRCYRRMA